MVIQCEKLDAVEVEVTENDEIKIQNGDESLEL